MRTSSKVVVGVLVAAALGAGCTDGGSGAAPPSTATREVPGTEVRPVGQAPVSLGGGGGARFLAAALTPFDACDPLLDHLRTVGLEQVTAWGLGDATAMGRRFLAGPTATVAASASDAGEAAMPSGGQQTSGTNTQVVGVDEPDVVKSDGRVLVGIVEGGLRVVDVSGPTPVERGHLDLDGLVPTGLFLEGDRVLVLATANDPSARRLAYDDWGRATETSIVEVDVADPAGPHEVARLTVDGYQVDARLHDGALRLVLHDDLPNGISFVTPDGSGLRAERAALAANQEAIRTSTVEDWLPWAVLRAGGTTTEGPLLGCDAVAHAPDDDALGMLAVVTLDARAPLAVADAVGVLSGGETVYASETAMYVAAGTPASRGDEPDAADDVTAVHAFDLTDRLATTYVASGTVPGRVLDQFSMDEADGVLRVASTRGTTWGRAGSDSDSVVTTLRRDGAELVQLGQVDGLGKGEAIQSVRFVGPMGYVVTFRQTDPLYTIDLHDPAVPVVAGELKVNGWSAYLHPVGDGLLLGVGQDATDGGRATGVQVSLFDVHDPAAPVRLAASGLGSGWSEVQQDHHAFLWWGPSQVAVVPVWGYDGANAAVVLRAHDGVLDEVGTVDHARGGPPEQAWDAAIQRSMVVGDELLTFSQRGLLASRLNDLAEQAWLTWS